MQGLRPRRVELRHLSVPLKRRVRHASHVRRTSDSLLVRVELSDGSAGHGEGVPREYVTGETIESTFETISTFDIAKCVGAPGNLDAALSRIDAIAFARTLEDPRGMNGNAARCALELALLDAYGRAFGVSIGSMIRGNPVVKNWARRRPKWVRYSGAVTASSPRSELKSALLMRLNMMHQIKVKVGVEGQNDPARLRSLRRVLGPRTDIRLDANEAWTSSELEEHVRPLLFSRPSALEQPVKHSELDALAELRPRLGVPIMLDESICGEPDAHSAIERRTADLFNLRLSKCGGILPTLRLFALAHHAGLGAQLGCHPGETGILSAAGRHVAANLEGWNYVEGSYDAYLLEENSIKENLTFHYGGFAWPLERPGLGVTIRPESIERMTVKRQVVQDD
jgi:muconate cycloisomerase